MRSPLKAGATSGTPVVPETPLDPTRPLSPDEVAQWLNVPTDAIKKLLRRGLRDAGVQIGTEWRFRAEEVWRWLKGRELSEQRERRHLKKIVEEIIPPHLRRPARKGPSSASQAAPPGRGADDATRTRARVRRRHSSGRRRMNTLREEEHA